MINDYLERAGHPERVASMSTRYRCKDKLPPAFFENVALLVRENLEARKKGGYSLPAFDPWDEPGHLNSEALVPILEAIRAGGGKTCVQTLAACFPTLSGKVDVRTYDMGSLAVAGGEAETPERVLELKRREGCLVGVYPNTVIMGGDPRAARQMYGAFAWAWNLDAVDPYKYWKILGDYRLSAGEQAGSFHPVLFDAEGDAVLTTASWENFAEGIYEHDLIQELTFRLGRPAPGVEPAAVAEAAAFLDGLRRDSAFHPSFVARGHDGLTGAPKFSRFNWHPLRFDRQRAELAFHLLRLSGVERGPHRRVCRAVAAEAQGLREREERIRAVQRAGAPPAREGNLIPHGGFDDRPAEPDAAGWRKWPGFESVSPNARILEGAGRLGGKGIRFEHRQAAPWDLVRTERIPLVPGKTYRFSGWARREAERAEDIAEWTGFQLKTYGATAPPGAAPGGDPFIQRVARWLPTNPPQVPWTRFEYPLTPGDSEQFLVITLYNNDRRSILYFDDLELREFDNL